MESRVPANEETSIRFKEIANKAFELTVQLQLLDKETQQLLEAEAIRLGVVERVEAYDFETNEFILAQPGKKEEDEE